MPHLLTDQYCLVHHFKIRVDDPENKYQDQMKQFIGKFNTHVLVQEHNPKDHYHCYVTTDLSHAGLRARLKKHIPKLEGNKSYAIQTNHNDWDFYIGYCYKHDDTDRISFQGLPHDEEWYRQYYLDKKEELEEARKRRRDQDRHQPVWETVSQFLQQEMFDLPHDYGFIIAMKEWATTDGPIPPQFQKYVETCVDATMGFLRDSGREVTNTKVRGYVENYLNSTQAYYRTRTAKKIAKQIIQ